MFNLIMGGEPDYFEHWPMYERVSGSCDFPISRMLEGTYAFYVRTLFPRQC